jgi:hypothetical protein
MGVAAFQAAECFLTLNPPSHIIARHWTAYIMHDTPYTRHPCAIVYHHITLIRHPLEIVISKAYLQEGVLEGW